MTTAVRILLAGCLSITISCGDEAEVPLGWEPAEAPPTELEAPSLSTGPALGPADAGDEAFVRRVIPLVWGRRAESFTEVALLTQAVTQVGRADVVRAMTQHPDYLSRWGKWLRDAMAVPRIGWYSNGGCYGRPALQNPDPGLAKHVRDTPYNGEPYPTDWTMFDLIESALLLDDLSAPYAANVVAMLGRALDDQNLLAAFGQRQHRAQTFARSYLNRRMMCLSCHNSEYSVTDDPDPEKDRFWPTPGQFEKALFGEHSGIPIVDLTPFFRRKGVIVGYFYAKDERLDSACPMGMCSTETLLTPEELAGAMYPWGWDHECGWLYDEENVWPDDYDGETYPFFIEEGREGNASIWHIQRSLQQSFSTLRAEGLVINEDGSVDPYAGLAWLTSQNIADQVWKEALGSRLTTSLYFPRTPQQLDILVSLTNAFVNNGYSLRELLVAVTTHSYFNGAVPGEDDEPAPYYDVFDPFVDDSIPMPLRRNRLDHTIHRMTARTLLDNTMRALGWPESSEFLLHFLEDDALIQAQAGVFHKPAQPGFAGVSFQSTLTWEAAMGLCENRAVAPACPLDTIFNLPEGQIKDATVCEICGTREYACDWDARCCDVDWSNLCDPLDCGEAAKFTLASFPSRDVRDGQDFIQRLVSNGKLAGATLGDLVIALKDRLLTDPTLRDGEEQILESLLGASLTSNVSTDAEAEQRLRRACGVFLMSPQYLLVGHPGRIHPEQASALPFTLPELERTAQCNTLVEYLFPDNGACDSDGALVVDQSRR